MELIFSSNCWGSDSGVVRCRGVSDVESVNRGEISRMGQTQNYHVRSIHVRSIHVGSIHVGSIHVGSIHVRSIHEVCHT